MTVPTSRSVNAVSMAAAAARGAVGERDCRHVDKTVSLTWRCQSKRTFQLITVPQRFLRRIRCGSTDIASGAHHTRPKRRHRHVIWPRVRTHDRPVVALQARHAQRPHAVGAHVAEGHRVAVDRGRVLMSLLGRRDPGNGATMAAFGESCRHRGHAFMSLDDPDLPPLVSPPLRPRT
jgi:hypothetical protein